MGSEGHCDCEELTEEGGAGGTSQGWIRWLDKRNEARAAWIALSVGGQLKALDHLATSIHELQKLGDVSAEAAPGVIRTKEELWSLAGNASLLAASPLSRLPKRDLEHFINFVKFEDYVQDGVRYQHVGTFYTGDLVEKHGFSYVELFQVFALFGIGPELGVRSYHKFGWDVERARCQPRMYYNCPWARDC